MYGLNKPPLSVRAAELAEEAADLDLPPGVVLLRESAGLATSIIDARRLKREADAMGVSVDTVAMAEALENLRDAIRHQQRHAGFLARRANRDE